MMKVKLDLKLIAPHLETCVEEIRSGELSHDTIQKVKAGWINPYSANEEYLHDALSHLNQSKVGVLECGSGLTSILLTAYCTRYSLPLVILEHHHDWYDIIKRSLRFLKLPFDHVHWTELLSYGDYDWYSFPQRLKTQKFDYVVCDGPPGTTKGGRYGLMPVMDLYLTPGAQIYLDDLNREGEVEVLNLWSQNFNVSHTVLGQNHKSARVIKA